MSNMSRGLAALVILTGLAGCGGDAEESVKYYPVAGVVRVDGKPTEGVSVTFVPEGNVPGGTSFGRSDAGGQYTLQNRSGAKGAAAGRFRVLLTQLTLPDGSPIPPDAMAADVGAVNQLPAGYNDLATTPIVVEVRAIDVVNEIDLEASTKFVPQP